MRTLTIVILLLAGCDQPLAVELPRDARLIGGEVPLRDGTRLPRLAKRPGGAPSEWAVLPVAEARALLPALPGMRALDAPRAVEGSDRIVEASYCADAAPADAIVALRGALAAEGWRGAVLGTTPRAVARFSKGVSELLAVSVETHLPDCARPGQSLVTLGLRKRL